MINKLSKNLTQKLMKENKIKEEEFELYHYGLFVMISEFSLLFFSLLVGIIFNVIFQSLIFYVVFFIIHRYAGGFHAKTELHCQIITQSSFLLGIGSIRFLENISIFRMLFWYLIFFIILIILSPADTPQKKLNLKEKKRFKKITVIIMITILFLIMVLYGFGISDLYVNSIMLAVSLETISVAFGKLFNKRLKSSDN